MRQHSRQSARYDGIAAEFVVPLSAVVGIVLCALAASVALVVFVEVVAPRALVVVVRQRVVLPAQLCFAMFF